MSMIGLASTEAEAILAEATPRALIRDGAAYWLELEAGRGPPGTAWGASYPRYPVTLGSTWQPGSQASTGICFPRVSQSVSQSTRQPPPLRYCTKQTLPSSSFFLIAAVVLSPCDSYLCAFPLRQRASIPWAHRHCHPHTSNFGTILLYSPSFLLGRIYGDRCIASLRHLSCLSCLSLRMRYASHSLVPKRAPPKHAIVSPPQYHTTPHHTTPNPYPSRFP
ncbi:hypothetical protein F4780DRAFT_267010 [Xylariomycetidae sp. FL0641]|nr:hypothetical protein F4780DRAFT_267010 [Xylariomycetidae sp. FL0641]